MVWGAAGSDRPRVAEPQRDYTRTTRFRSAPTTCKSHPGLVVSLAIDLVGRPRSIRTSGAVRVGRGWEESGAPSSVPTIPFGCLVGVAVRLPSWGFWFRQVEPRKDGIGMKNTGKRIFAAIVFAALVSLPLIGSAGVLFSQR